MSNAAERYLWYKIASVKILDPNGPVTLLSMYGQPGDYINAGQLLLTTQDGTFTPSRSGNNDVTTFDPDSTISSQPLFVAPNSAVLA